MSRAFAVTQVIDRPVDQVWRVLTDWDRAAEWMPGIDAVHVDGDTLRFRARGRERTSAITGVRPGESVTLTSVQGAVRADYTYTIAEADAGTRATLVADLTVRSFWRVAAPVLRVAVRRADGRQLDALKRLVETGR
jgi:uncharacterized protein YndB with AHSA1/START domain